MNKDRLEHESLFLAASTPWSMLNTLLASATEEGAMRLTATSRQSALLKPQFRVEPKPPQE